MKHMQVLVVFFITLCLFAKATGIATDAENAKPYPENAKPHPENAKHHTENAKPHPENAKPQTENAKPNPENAKPHPENANLQAENAKDATLQAENHQDATLHAQAIANRRTTMTTYSCEQGPHPDRAGWSKCPPSLNGEALGEVSGGGILMNSHILLKLTATATLSSSHYTNYYPASKCVDGNLNNFCHSSGLASDPDPSLTLDLGTATQVAYVVLYNRRGCCQESLGDYTVSYRIGSTDTWAVCAEESAAADALGPLRSECPHMAQYVMIKLPASGAQNGLVGPRKLNLAEVEVWGTPAEQGLPTKIFDGECEDSELRMYNGKWDGNGDNAGTLKQKVARCSEACLSKKAPKHGSWSGFNAKGFIIEWHTGRCYCESGNSTTCKRLTGGSSPYNRYDWRVTNATVAKRMFGLDLLNITKAEQTILGSEIVGIMEDEYYARHARIKLKYTKSRIQHWTTSGDGGEIMPTYGRADMYTNEVGNQVCALKYGYSAVVNNTGHAKVYVFMKIACSKDLVNYVTRRNTIGGWGIQCGSHCLGCYANFKKASCRSVARVVWQELPMDDSDKLGSSIQ